MPANSSSRYRLHLTSLRPWNPSAKGNMSPRKPCQTVRDVCDALEDTLDILSDPAAVREIAEAREAAARGEGLDIAAVRRRYLSHGA